MGNTIRQLLVNWTGGFASNPTKMVSASFGGTSQCLL